jgi:hypothetical protein
MTYAYRSWEFATDTHLLKLHRLQNKVPAPLAIFQGAQQSATCTRVSACRYVYDYIINLAAEEKQTHTKS